MSDFLVVLDSSITKADREAVQRIAPATQSISNRVFLSAGGDAVAAGLRSMSGVAMVLTGAEPGPAMPQLDDSERLFVQAWLSTRGQVKHRRGDGMDWDTPPMLPPDAKR